jgi:hypothetical protein
MNTKTHNSSNTAPSFGAVCLNSCRKLLRQLAQIKASVLHEFETGLRGHQELLKAAVTEAEALAWQTPYPHLFFPVLAEEKAAAVSRWAKHQSAVRHSTQARAFAA